MRLVRIMTAPHCMNASKLFHSRALLIPYYIIQLLSGDMLSHWVILLGT